MIGSDIYQRLIAPVDDNLMHKVWDGTPWIVDAFTGPIDNYGRYREIMDWCRGEFGDEAWPIHGKPGNWHCGGATVNGWTWIGFANEEMMQKFIEMMLYNEHGGGAQNEAAYADLKRRIDDLANRLLCPCRG